MKPYIYKKIKEHEEKGRCEGVRIPIYIWREHPDPNDNGLGDEDKDNSDNKRGYEEIDFNIDNFIIINQGAAL